MGGPVRDPAAPAARWPAARPAGAWPGLVLYALLASLGFAWLAEWEQYRHLVGWRTADVNAGARLLVTWALASRSLILLAGPLLLAGALVRARRAGWAWAALVAASLLLFGWLTVDLRVGQVTRTSVADYLVFLTTPTAGEWAGGAAPIARALGRAVGATAGALALLAGVCAWLGGMAARAWPALGGPAAAALLAATYAGITLGVGPAGALGGDPRLLARLDAVLPLSAAWRPAGGEGFLHRFNADVAARYRSLQPRIVRADPADTGTTLPPGPRPHVVLLVLESLRHDALEPAWMPRLAAWARGGRAFSRHYAASNSTHLGLFALLYGRHPLVYEETLNAGVAPQLPETLRRSGYRTAFVSGGTLRWRRLEEFVNARHFDRLVVDEEGDWPERDRRTLGRVAALLREPGPPWAIVAFLVSTHFEYRYPPEYERHRPTVERGSLGALMEAGAAGADVQAPLMNRYRNALAFLDDALADTLDRLGPAPLILLTGDHGESLFDDGSWMHAGRLSEIQTRVPLVLRGPGIAPGAIGPATSHVDVVPTLVHALAREPLTPRGVHGRSLLGPLWADQVLLTAPSRPQRGVFVRGDRRLGLRLALDGPRIFSPGFVDARDDLDDAPLPPAADAATWAAALGEELERLAR